MVELGKLDAKKRNIVWVRDEKDRSTLSLAAIHLTDAAAIELLARDHPGSQHAALDVILGVNKKN